LFYAFMPQKVAILGGTFNPIHLGHLIMAEAALEQFCLDRILWIPTGCPLYKSTTELVDFTHRLTMVRLAIATQPQFEVSAVEQLYAVSYAIETFSRLQALHPGNQWFWLIGLDAIRSLPQWHGRQELVPQCVWLVAPRGEMASQAQKAICEQVATQLWAEGIRLEWRLLEMPLIGISSGLVRQFCRDRRSIRYWVPDAVNAYIQDQGLYQV
jgi:nicotinate-nucleotide adenylyltransferase